MTMDPSNKTLIVGLGRTGLSVARFLGSRKIPFAVIDSRRRPSEYDRFRALFPDAEVKLGGFDSDDFSSARNIIVSPGVPCGLPGIRRAAEHGAAVIGDIELFARNVSAGKPIAAVTGSNGKSTVVTLLARMAQHAGLKAALGGNMETPALDLIEDEPGVDVYILELSSFQLETTHSLNLDASVILNTSEDHLDRYDSFEAYCEAKRRIHRNSKVVVVNREDCGIAVDRSQKQVNFGLGAPAKGHFGVADADGEKWIFYGKEAWIACDELEGLPGVGGWLNAQAALAIGLSLGLPRDAMLSALRSFTGLPHRLQFLGNAGGVRWINDSKATNVAAACMALASIPGPIVWIAGGDGKNADFMPLAEAARDKVVAALLFGCDAEAVAEVMRSAGVAVRLVADLDEAVCRARETAEPGACVLLSPACSSLDMYADYAERGNRFVTGFEAFADA